MRRFATSARADARVGITRRDPDGESHQTDQDAERNDREKEADQKP